MSIIFSPVGVIHTPFKEPKGTPIQTTAGRNVQATVEIFPEYEPGLKDLEGFSHIYLIFHLHLAGPCKLVTRPFLDTEERGIFSIRGPNRPNPIGISIVRLVRVEGNILHIRDVDMVDGTPLLDIKPYIPRVDRRDDYTIGWLEGKVEHFEDTVADRRFTDRDREPDP